MHKGNIITHQHQDLTPKSDNGIYRSMWEKPDLDDQTATELLQRIEKILEEEKNRGNLIETKDNLE